MEGDDVLKDIPNRYSRNINSLTPLELEKLRRATVCIVGLGGLGGYVMEQLARAGIKKLKLADGDVFEESNLNRQLLANEATIGMKKVEAAVERVRMIDSEIEIESFNGYITELNGVEFMQGSDVVVDALDSIDARFMIADIARKLNVPLVHGSIGGWYGQVSTLFPGDSTLEKLFKRKTGAGVEVELGNLGPTAGVIASIQSSEVIKLIAGKGELLRECVLRVDLLENEYETIRFK